jgi:hypothetical protein
MATIQEKPRAWQFLLSKAEPGYRSLENIVLAQGAADAIVLEAGTLLMADTTGAPGTYIPATAAGATAQQINAILGAAADTRAGPVEAAAIVRDAEVIDAYLLFYESNTAGAPIDRDEAIASLELNNIHVRKGVLAESIVVPPPNP